MQDRTFQVIIRCLKIQMREFLSSLYKREVRQIFESSGYFSETSNNIFEKVESETYSKRELIEKLFELRNWEEENTILDFIRLIEVLLKAYNISPESKEYLRSTCRDLGFDIAGDGSKIFHPTLSNIYNQINLFKSQFPAGLPFGKFKPELVVKGSEGGQEINFEWRNGLAIIKENVYPNLSYKLLARQYGCDEENKAFGNSLTNMNQTATEREFFIKYGKKFDVRHREVPVLIPQAWIQWHSQIKRKLDNFSSLKQEDIYRPDFVAFWQNERTAIFIDDIGHYSEMKNEIWIASPKKYSLTLQEGRRLYKQGWKIFRVANSEISSKSMFDEVLDDLKCFINF